MGRYITLNATPVIPRGSLQLTVHIKKVQAQYPPVSKKNSYHLQYFVYELMGSCNWRCLSVLLLRPETFHLNANQYNIMVREWVSESLLGIVTHHDSLIFIRFHSQTPYPLMRLDINLIMGIVVFIIWASRLFVALFSVLRLISIIQNLCIVILVWQ